MFKNVSLIVLPVVLILIGAPILVLLYYLALLHRAAAAAARQHDLRLDATPTARAAASPTSANSKPTMCSAPRPPEFWGCTGRTAPAGFTITGCYRYALLGVLVDWDRRQRVSGCRRSSSLVGAQPSLVVTLIRALALGIFFVIDYAQTTVLSSLTTLIVPTYAENESNARLWASKPVSGAANGGLPADAAAGRLRCRTPSP